MFEKLEGVERRFEEIEDALSMPDMTGEELIKLTKERAEIEALVVGYRRYLSLQQDRVEAEEMLASDDADMRSLGKEEMDHVDVEVASLRKELLVLLLPSDPNDAKNVMLEIRAGTGGDEAGLFVSDLLRMYTRYAESQKWKVEILSATESVKGGFKEVVCSISGNRVFSRLKYEMGVHRVQRIPQTESQGRIHTSACTVAILPEVGDVEVDINPADLRIDTYRSSGAGGQHVNTTDSAVRITHAPTGVVAECQDERSQHKNRDKAMKMLRARIYESLERARLDSISADRKQQVGSGDRSERIRTYNFPQGRLTDHRINLTLYRLSEVMSGDLKDVLDALGAHYTAEKLKSQDLGA